MSAPPLPSLRMPDRTYTQEEVAALFERAAELQARSADRGDRAGLTLAELEHIAAEAGLDPAHLRAAVEELAAPSSVRAAPSGTSATHVHVERRVPGPLQDESWEAVVAELRHRFDSDLAKTWGMGTGYGTSTVEQVGRSVEWRHTSMAGVETRVLVQPRGEELRVRASQRVGMASTEAESVMYGVLAAVLVGMVALPLSGASGALGWGIAVTLLVLLAAVPLIYRLDQGWRRKKHHELEHLADHVAETLAQPATARTPAPTAPLEASRQEARLDIPEEPAAAEPTAEEAALTRRRVRS